jgi:methylmalonyl-CoA mutase N-terminal domain/subunit
MEKEMRNAALKYQRDVDSRKRTVVGVNEFVDEGEPQWQMLKQIGSAVVEYDPGVRDRQIARLDKVKRERDQARVEQAKEQLHQGFRSGVNMVPIMIEAVKSYISAGEIGEVRRKALGAVEERVLGMQPIASRGE